MPWLVQITSGRGPQECCLLVDKIANYLLDAAERAEEQILVLDEIEAEDKNSYHSKTLLVISDSCPAWLATWEGTIKWVCKSPYRPHHKRSNWFAGVSLREIKLDESDWSEIRKEDLKIEAFQASGPGGQHVNKTSSAVRITHIPTGVIVTARESRSQHENKKIAMQKLKQRLENQDEERTSESSKSQWSNHNQLERGNPVKTFKGLEFEQV